MTAEPIFRASSYDEVLAGLNARRKSLGLSMEVLDELAGIAKGYSGKVFGGKRVKTLGPLSFTLLVGALGGELWFVDRDAAKMSGEKDAKLLEFSNYYRVLGRKGGRIRRARLSDFRRSQIARKAGRANGAKWRAIRAMKRAKERKVKRSSAAARAAFARAPQRAEVAI